MSNDNVASRTDLIGRDVANFRRYNFANVISN